jgi:hypothetical protein
MDLEGKMEIKVTARCLRCGRALRAAASVARGYGRTCQARVRTAAATVDLTAYKPFQVAKATEVIEQGAIIPTSRRTVYRAVSSDGSTVYLTTTDACTCPAGQKGRACYHRAAVIILTAAAPARRAA